uniref:Uncharacterized protein n=1 Tax=Arundo donax TaxID=35708 RepID=A0A0A9CMI3_ARUDO
MSPSYRCSSGDCWQTQLCITAPA